MLLTLVPSVVLAQVFARPEYLDPSAHPLALVMLGLFSLAYLAVVFEEKIGVSKSRPMTFAAGFLWVMAAWLGHSQGRSEEELKAAVTHNLGEFAELFLFLLAAIIYIKRLEERNVFAVLKGWLITRGYNYRQLFVISGILAFFLSAIADNLTTALVMGAVVMAVGKESKEFVALSCIHIVVACNAGGAFSPFGDITTLMVWQAGKVEFFQFFALFTPSLITYLIPAFFMYRRIPEGAPLIEEEDISLKRQARLDILLFLVTICLAVSFEQVLGLPPYMGMITGLSLLMLCSYIGLKRSIARDPSENGELFSNLADAEWDTLLFFFGVMYCVGALGYVGYLSILSNLMYEGFGPSVANISAGLASAVIDNIPVMFSVLQMDPQMSLQQWLLLTLTTGVGGSLLAVGSAAGVALMGQSQGQYTFLSHLRWSWAILLGYIGGIASHFLLIGA